MTKDLNLLQVFKAVSKTLKENQEALNEADVHNHDHGTNMVNTFKLIQKAVKAKENESASEQLAYASQLVREKSSSGSALLYADGLENAAKEFEGKSFDRSGVGTLLNSLMGLPQNAPQAQVQPQTPTAPANADFLSTLIGGLASNQTQQTPQAQEPIISQTPDLIDLLGGISFQQEPIQQQPQTPPPSQPSATDLVSSLLGGLAQSQTPIAPKEEPKPSGLGGLLGSLFGGSQSQQPPSTPSAGGMGGVANLLGSLLGGQSNQPAQQPAQQGGISGTSLLSAALAYFMATQQGKTPFESIFEAVGTATRFSDRADRTQSGALVANTLIGLLSK